jgi:hypothetical protein
MTKYTASVEPSGKTHKIGPYRLGREHYIDSDGSCHGGWILWSGDYEIGTGSRGNWKLLLLPFKHWQHIRKERQWNKKRGEP